MNDFVYLSECNSYCEEDIKQAFTNLFKDNNLLDFIKPGLKVGIKLNLVSPMKPEKAATIHPELVKQVCKILIDNGCTVTLGDSPGGLFTESALKQVYNVCGIEELSNDFIKLNFNVDTCVKEINGLVVKKLDCTSWLFDQDVIINISKLKSHGMMGLSGAVKNLFGTIPGLLKPEYHYRYTEHNDFANMLIDINEFYKPVLNIMDAVLAMEGNGPTQGTPRKIGLLLASKNPYDLDLVAAKLIDMPFDHVRTMTESINRNLAVKDFNSIQLNMDFTKYIVKDFKKIKPSKDMKFNMIKGPLGKLVEKILTVKPVCTKKNCIGCAKCYNICPAHAITMIDKIPHIDRNKCIRCFCCQEFCPVGAMKTKKNGLVKLLTKGKNK